MKFADLFGRQRSATTAHHRLQVLLMHERCGGNPDLIPILREDILAAINKHVAVDPDKVRLKIDRGEMVCVEAVLQAEQEDETERAPDPRVVDRCPAKCTRGAARHPPCDLRARPRFRHSAGRVEDLALRDLAGVSLEVEARCGNGRFRESLLFTHRGLSGPAILQISSFWQLGDAVTLAGYGLKTSGGTVDGALTGMNVAVFGSTITINGATQTFPP